MIYQIFYSLFCSMIILFALVISLESIEIFTTEHLDHYYGSPTIVIYTGQKPKQLNINSKTITNVRSVRNVSSPLSSKTSHDGQKKQSSILVRLRHIPRNQNDRNDHDHYRLRLVNSSSPEKQHETILVKSLTQEYSVLMDETLNRNGFSPIRSCMNGTEQVSMEKIEFFHASNQTKTKIYTSEDYSTLLLVTYVMSSVNDSTEAVWIYGLIDGRMMILPRFDMTKLTSTKTKRWHYTIHQLITNGFENIRLMFDNLHNEHNNGIWSVMKQSAETCHGIFPEITLVIDHYILEMFRNEMHMNDDLLREYSWRYSTFFVQMLHLLYFKQIRLEMISKQIDVHIHLKQILLLVEPIGFQRIQPILKGNLLYKSQTNSTTNTYLNALNGLDQFGRWFYDNYNQIGQTDIFLVLTGQNLCLTDERPKKRSVEKKSKMTRTSCSYGSVRGQAVVGGACRHRDQQLKRSLNLAIVQDRLFTDKNSLTEPPLHVAAHELGHLLGAVHDGEWPRASLLGPGARNCLNGMSTNHGNRFIMSVHHKRELSDKEQMANNRKWSECTLEQFEHFFRQPQAFCLLNKPFF